VRHSLGSSKSYSSVSQSSAQPPTCPCPSGKAYTLTAHVLGFEDVSTTLTTYTGGGLSYVWGGSYKLVVACGHGKYSVIFYNELIYPYVLASNISADHNGCFPGGTYSLDAVFGVGTGYFVTITPA
jgi:hypothetical protein